MGIFKKMREKKAEEKRQKEEWKKFVNSLEETHIKNVYRVVGVTFRNPGGCSRQDILEELFRNQLKCNMNNEISFREYLFEGKPAMAVEWDGDMIGNIAESSVASFKKHLEKAEHVIAEVDYFDKNEYEDDKDFSPVYTCEIALWHPRKK